MITTWPELNLVDPAARPRGSSRTRASIPTWAPPERPWGCRSGPLSSPLCSFRERPRDQVGRVKGHGDVRVHRVPSNTLQADPRRHPGRHHRRIGFVDRLDPRRRGIRGCPANCAEDRVDDNPGAAIAALSSAGCDPWRAPPRRPSRTARVLGELLARRQQQGLDLESRLAQHRAATRPSPPLFPLPQTMAARRGATSAAASATARPALSISSSEGTRCSLIAQASVTAHLIGVQAGIEPVLHRG